MKYVSLQVPLGLLYKNLYKFAIKDKIHPLNGVSQDSSCLRLMYCSVESQLETPRYRKVANFSLLNGDVTCLFFFKKKLYEGERKES